MFLKRPELTAGSRPILQHDETLLFVQNAVGLYENKSKIADCQNGHAYLTSHRACYVDDTNPKDNSLAVDLKDVDRSEHAPSFLRSSAKVTIHPKPLRRGPGSLRQNTPLSPSIQRLQVSSSSPGSRSASPFRPNQVSASPPVSVNANWICPICSFTNPVPSNFDPATASEATSLPPCLTCGIKPPLAVILKAAISADMSHLPSKSAALTSQNLTTTEPRRQSFSDPETLICPRCTFHNHPSLQTCEMCQTPLPVSPTPRLSSKQESNRPSSPAPEVEHASQSDEPVSIKFSFRAGGDRVFFERLKGAMVQRKWLAASAPPAPKPLDDLRSNSSEQYSTRSASSEGRNSPRSSRVGIAGLENLGKQTRIDNETVIGAAFEDLESLMALDKEVSALAQRIAREYGDDANRTDFDADLNGGREAAMVATKDTLSNSSDKLYISELSRNLAEYVSDEQRGLLRRRGGIMSLVDLWATFNRSLDGVEMVTPADFHKAAAMWASLQLPVRLREFRSGLLAVQYAYTSDERTIEQVKKWLEKLRAFPPEDSPWDWNRYGCGITAQDAAKKFGWSLGIAREELEMAEEKGALIRDDSVEGLKFWLNFFDEAEEDSDNDNDDELSNRDGKRTDYL